LYGARYNRDHIELSSVRRINDQGWKDQNFDVASDYLFWANFPTKPSCRPLSEYVYGVTLGISYDPKPIEIARVATDEFWDRVGSK